MVCILLICCFFARVRAQLLSRTQITVQSLLLFPAKVTKFSRPLIFILYKAIISQWSKLIRAFCCTLRNVNIDIWVVSSESTVHQLLIDLTKVDVHSHSSSHSSSKIRFGSQQRVFTICAWLQLAPRKLKDFLVLVMSVFSLLRLRPHLSIKKLLTFFKSVGRQPFFLFFLNHNYEIVCISHV